MTGQKLPSLSRLASANPVHADEDRGRTPDAQAALAAILASERPADPRSSRPQARRVLVLALAALLLAVGAALAATDPFGLFRSPNPGTAIFAVDRGQRVQPTTMQRVQCPEPSGQVFRCGPGLVGRRYRLLEHVEANGPAGLSRRSILEILRQQVRRGRIPVQSARRIDADLAAVSDSFLARLLDLMRYATTTTDLTPEGAKALAPPPGVPALLVCVPEGRFVSCRDLNGDDHAAVGSGIYQALPAPDWRPAPRHQQEPGWRLIVGILGHTPTAAELRLLIDFETSAGHETTSSHSSASPRGAPGP